jgi:hypothetical protein
MTVLKIISLVSALVSAACWFVSAFLHTGQGRFWWDAAPANIQRNIKIYNILNAAAALLTGLSVVTQAWP